MKQNTKGRRCYLYVLNTLADWEVGYITAELNSRRYIPEDRMVELILLGNTTDAVRTMGGITIRPEKGVDELEFREGDMLILPGGDTWMEEENYKILDRVPSLLEKKVIVAAICGATAALANRGILDNRTHTSNDVEFLKIFCPEYRGSSFYVDSPAVTDDNLITASGLAPLEFSREVFQKISAMKPDTLDAWYHLYQSRDSKYFYTLMESLE